MATANGANPPWLIQDIRCKSARPMKYVMIYETDPQKLSLAQAHFKAHRARLDEFHARGTLLMAGPYENPMEGALGIFTSREAAVEFIKGDPFVSHGVVKEPIIRAWVEVLS
jgi:uncharacterized protein